MRRPACLSLRFLGALATVLLLLATAAPAAADWLVLTNGDRIETRGPWEARRGLVVFTDAFGRLLSLRLADVDLEASRDASIAAAKRAAAPAAAAPPRAERPRARFVLTDADVRHARAAPEAAEAPATEPKPTAGERLVVVDWQEGELPDHEGVTLSGILRNRSQDVATGIQLTALLYGSDGSLLTAGQARLGTDSLLPRRQTRFTVDFPGVFHMAAVKFTTSSLAFETAADGGETAPEEPPA